MIKQEKINQKYVKTVCATSLETFTAGVRFAETELKQIALEFAEFYTKKCYQVWEGTWRVKDEPQIIIKDKPELFDKFMAERSVPTCDICGSSDITDVPHMGRNCNNCHPIKKRSQGAEQYPDFNQQSIKCDACGCNPSVIIRTPAGSFCQLHAKYT